MTARSATYLKQRLKSGQPDVIGTTTVLAQNGIDIIDSLAGTLSGYVPDFNFPAESPAVVTSLGVASPSRQLFAGLPAIVRFSVVPTGVNGNDTAHYLYINDGASSEAVLITGGAGRSGDSNGLINFTPASNHTGLTWTITSASSGWVEQVTANPTYLSIFGPEIINLYAPVTLPAAHPGAIGQGKYVTFIDAYFTGASIISTSALYSTWMRFQVRPRSGVMTAGFALNFTVAAIVVVEDVRLGATGGNICVYGGIKMVGGDLVTRGTWINAEFRGYDVTGASCDISDVHVVSERTILNYIADSASLYLNGPITTVRLRGFWHDAGMFAYGWFNDLRNGYINEVHVDDLYLDNWALAGYASIGTVGTAGSYNIGTFQIVDDNAFFGTLVAGFCFQFNGKEDGWTLTGGRVVYAYGFGINVLGSLRNLGLSNVSLGPCIVSVGNAAIAVTAGAPSLIRTDDTCNIGGSVDGGVTTTYYGFFNSRVIDHLTLRGQFGGVSQAGKITLSGTETNVSINGEGIGNLAKSVASAAGLAFPVMNDNDTLTISGATGVTSVSGLREGQQGSLISANTVTWTAGATIGNTFTPTTNQRYGFTFTGGKIWLG